MNQRKLMKDHNPSLEELVLTPFNSPPSYEKVPQVRDNIQILRLRSSDTFVLDSFNYMHQRQLSIEQKQVILSKKFVQSQSIPLRLSLQSPDSRNLNDLCIVRHLNIANRKFKTMTYYDPAQFYQFRNVSKHLLKYINAIT